MGRKVAVQARAAWVPLPEPPALPNELDVAELDADDCPADETLTSQTLNDEALAEDSADDELSVEALASDNVGEQSIEINVENLIAELEAESQRGQTPDVRCARRKLEDYLERKRIAQEIEDFEDFKVEDLEVE